VTVSELRDVLEQHVRAYPLANVHEVVLQVDGVVHSLDEVQPVWFGAEGGPRVYLEASID